VPFLRCVFCKFDAKVWKHQHVKSTKVHDQPRQPRAAYMSTHPSTLACLEKLALPRNYGSHIADVYCLGSTPRFTTATRVQSLGFWATYMSKIRDVAASRWCWPAAHRRPARSDSLRPKIALFRLGGGQMTSGLLQRSVCTNAGTYIYVDLKAVLPSDKL
jgi:hypothetical protein